MAIYLTQDPEYNEYDHVLSLAELLPHKRLVLDVLKIVKIVSIDQKFFEKQLSV